jgi:aminoglycoside phosphotransferase (APT) family kinase protein
LSDVILTVNAKPDAWHLSFTDVANLLLSWDLIDARAVVDNKVVVRDFSSGRHYVFSAEGPDGANYLLKQNPRIDSVAREAAVYEELSALPAIRRLIPALHRYDRERNLLLLEFISDGVDLAAYHRDVRRPSIRIAKAIGANLAELHSNSPHRQPDDIASRPSAMTLHRPRIRAARDSSPACLELIRILQNTDGFDRSLDAVRRSWQVGAFIHRDVRFKNFLLSAPVRGMRNSDLKLIDWELACFGDPRWDIGSALGNYLSLWLESIPYTERADVADATQLAKRPLSAIQPAIAACWRAYVAGRGLAGEAADRILVDTVGFAATRLVQSAYEFAQGALRLTTASVMHLQVALNMLTRPEDTVAHLYGLADAGSAGDPSN